MRARPGAICANHGGACPRETRRRRLASRADGRLHEFCSFRVREPVRLAEHAAHRRPGGTALTEKPDALCEALEVERLVVVERRRDDGPDALETLAAAGVALKPMAAAGAGQSPAPDSRQLRQRAHAAAHAASFVWEAAFLNTRAPQWWETRKFSIARFDTDHPLEPLPCLADPRRVGS